MMADVSQRVLYYLRGRVRTNKAKVFIYSPIRPTPVNSGSSYYVGYYMDDKQSNERIITNNHHNIGNRQEATISAYKEKKRRCSATLFMQGV